MIMPERLQLFMSWSGLGAGGAIRHSLERRVVATELFSDVLEPRVCCHPRSRPDVRLEMVPEREEEGQVEEGAAKVQLELDGPAEPELGGGQVAAVHGEHAEVEVDPLVDLTLAHDLVEPVHGQLAEVAAPALLDQHR